MRALPLIVLLMLTSAAAAQDSERLVRGPTRPVQAAVLGPMQEGVVQSIHVAEGDRVQRGDVLLRLLDTVQEARIALMRASAAAEGEARQAAVLVDEAEAVLRRTHAAAARAAATDWEVRQATARRDAAKAAAQAASDRRGIEQQKLALELATRETLILRSPFDGTVTRVDATPGSTLARTDRPLMVADLTSLEAILYLPADHWPRLKIGETYRLVLSAPVGRAVDARLRYADPVLDAGSGRFRAVFLIDNPRLEFPAGTEATLDLAELAP